MFDCCLHVSNAGSASATIFQGAGPALDSCPLGIDICEGVLLACTADAQHAALLQSNVMCCKAHPITVIAKSSIKIGHQRACISRMGSTGKVGGIGEASRF